MLTAKKNLNTSIQLQLDIMMAEYNAKSLIAKYIFDSDNRKEFYSFFKNIPPKSLIAELNQITISIDTFEKIKLVIAKKDEFPIFFNLHPHKWLHFLLEEQIHIEDLQALIGSGETFEGAVSGVLDDIQTLKDPVLCAWTYYYLLNYQKVNENEMNVFLDSLETKDESFRASFIQLHRLLNNTMIHTHHEDPDIDDDSISTCFVTESLLRIRRPVPPRRDQLPTDEYKIAEQKYQFLQSQCDARIHAACRLIRECILNAYSKILNKLDKRQMRVLHQLQERQDDCCVTQLIAKEFEEFEQKNSVGRIR